MKTEIEDGEYPPSQWTAGELMTELERSRVDLAPYINYLIQVDPDYYLTNENTRLDILVSGIHIFAIWKGTHEIKNELRARGIRVPRWEGDKLCKFFTRWALKAVKNFEDVADLDFLQSCGIRG